MPARKQGSLRRGSKGQREDSAGQSILRGVADELGLTDPETDKRPRRKGPVRVTALKKRAGDDGI